MTKTLNSMPTIMDLTNNKSISKKSYLQRIITKKLNSISNIMNLTNNKSKSLKKKKFMLALI